MKPESREAIYDACPHLTSMQLKDFIRALESTDEQRTLRMDAERYRCFRVTFGIAVPDDDGTVIWSPDEIDRAIDRALCDAEMAKDAAHE